MTTPPKNTATQLLDSLHARASKQKVDQSYAGQSIKEFANFRMTCEQLLNAGPSVAVLAQRHQATLELADPETKKKITQLTNLVVNDVKQFRGLLDGVIARADAYRIRVEQGLESEDAAIHDAIEIGQEFAKWMGDYESVLHGNVASLSDLIEMTVQSLQEPKHVD